MNQIEHFFMCPRCGEEISFLLEPREQAQHYVEDCEVCCNPIAVTVRCRDEEVVSFDARLAN